MAIFSQAQRDSVMNRFRTKNLQMLVATDVAARGIDVTNLTHIINYNLPDDMKTIPPQRPDRPGRVNPASPIVIINLKEAFVLNKLKTNRQEI